MSQPTRDNPPPLGPLWGLVFPLLYGKWSSPDFEISGVAGTAFIPAPGVVVSCAHCFDGLPEWDYAIALMSPTSTKPMAVVSEIDVHADGYDLAVGRIIDPRFTPLPPFHKLAEALIGADVFAPGYPLPERRRRSVDEPLQHFITARGLRGHVTATGAVTELGRYGQLPSLELDFAAPGGLSGAPIFRWGLVSNPLQLAGVIRGVIVVSTIRDEPFPSDPDADEEPERYTFGLGSPMQAVASLSGRATEGRPLGDLIAERWPY